MTYIVRQLKTGVNGFPVSVIYIDTNDISDDVLTEGYLGPEKNDNGVIFNNKQIAFVYTTDLGMLECQVSVVNGIASLIFSNPPPPEDGNVYTSLPSTPNEIPIFVDENGILESVPGSSSTSNKSFFPGNISAGIKGVVAGVLTSYANSPRRGDSGKLVFAHAPNTSGDYASTLFDGIPETTIGVRQNTTYNFPDPNQTTGSIQVAAMPNSDSDPCSNLIVVPPVSLNYINLGGTKPIPTVPIFFPRSLTPTVSRYQILSINMYVVTLFDNVFSSGDIIITDGQTIYSVIPTSTWSNFSRPVSVGQNWTFGSTQVPFPTNASVFQFTRPITFHSSPILYAQMRYGATQFQYNAGEIILSMVLQRVT